MEIRLDTKMHTTYILARKTALGFLAIKAYIV
jgi:hypothetical protein